MNKITQKIYDILIENNVEKNQILNMLSKVYQDIENTLWENLTVSPQIFYGLKDVVWYNLEHLLNNGEEIGVSDLRYLATEFPYLIYCCNDDNFIPLQEISGLLNELEILIKKWNKNWIFANLVTKSPEGWQGGEDPSTVIIYKRGESFTKYGYNQTYNRIVDVKGNPIIKYDSDTVLCCLYEPIGEYAQGQILYSLLLDLINTCKKALKHQLDIRLIFE